MSASKMFLPMSRKNKMIPSRQKQVDVYKSRNQLLQEFLKKHHGPLTLQNSKFLNAQVKIHKRRKEEADKRHKLIVINQPNKSVFKGKNKTQQSKPKSPTKNKTEKSKQKSPKCNTPRCKALKMKNQKICDAKIKNGGAFCKRHRKSQK